MTRLFKEKKLVLAGPLTDTTTARGSCRNLLLRGAMQVFEAARMNEAEDFVRNDLAVQSEVFKAELHPWKVTIPNQEGSLTIVENRTWNFESSSRK